MAEEEGLEPPTTGFGDQRDAVPLLFVGLGPRQGGRFTVVGLAVRVIHYEDPRRGCSRPHPRTTAVGSHLTHRSRFPQAMMKATMNPNIRVQKISPGVLMSLPSELGSSCRAR